MPELRWFDESARQRFAALGIATLSDLAGLDQGDTVSTARTRTTRRLVLGGTTYYVKVQDLRGKALPWRRWPSYALRGSPVGREAQSLYVLHSHGFKTPRLVACGERRGPLLPELAALITEELAHHVDLARWLVATPDPEARARALAAAEALVRRAHERGLVLLGAKLRNILLPEVGAEGPDDLALIDQPDLRRSRAPWARRRDWRLLAADRERSGTAP